MKRQASFNKLFENGISYKEYLNKSEKYEERMNNSFLAAQKALKRFSQDKISRMNEKLHVLCIAENSCIDCANGVPIIAVLANKSPNWKLRIVSRDNYRMEFESFFTTAGRKKIPVIIFADGPQMRKRASVHHSCFMENMAYPPAIFINTSLLSVVNNTSSFAGDSSACAGVIKAPTERTYIASSAKMKNLFVSIFFSSY